MLQNHLSFSLPWAIPFCGFLLSLALVPILAPKFWHKRYGLILLGWATSFLIAHTFVRSIASTAYILAETMVHHYIPFMALITVLYTVGGGIHITMKGKASPLMNAGLLGVGALSANIIGTMGASMLLIRPVMALNRYRQKITHVMIFFIFLVSNIGGLLTPLGDPPLFIGFLNGIDFFWTTTHLIVPFLLIVGIVLVIFWVIDHYYFYHDPSVPDPSHMHGEAKIRLSGKRNFIFLTIAIAIIIFESMLSKEPHVDLFGLSINLGSLARDVILFALAIASWKFTPPQIHESNRFTWDPLEEVAIVFFGIFVTVIPVLAMLKMGESGPFGGLIHFANPNNTPNASIYFWLTGLLSSILDNAPTYLVFFNMAGGDPTYLMEQGAPILGAISMGAVFMGALTYIGNAPNFMVRSIAARSHIKMPGFLGYFLWSTCILIPIFIGFSWFWFP